MYISKFIFLEENENKTRRENWKIFGASEQRRCKIDLATINSSSRQLLFKSANTTSLLQKFHSVWEKPP